MKLLHFSIVVLLCLTFCGCGSGDSLNRCSVEGTVTLGGVPVDNGYVSFKPEPGTQCPDVAGQIKNGKFHIPQSAGPVAGSYSVTITASMPTGKKVKEPYTGKEVDEYKQLIPPQYTGETGKSLLNAKIVQGKNTVDFNLESDTKSTSK